MSRKTGYPEPNLSRVERGRLGISLPSLVKLATTLDMSDEALGRAAREIAQAGQDRTPGQTTA